MYVLETDKVLFVDVDNTLVIWEGAEWRPNIKYVTLVKQFANRGQGVVVWSAGGYEWATRVVYELGLRDYVDAILCKPAWFADDQQSQEFMPEHNRIFFEE